jgi:hypothetical protein
LQKVVHVAEGIHVQTDLAGQPVTGRTWLEVVDNRPVGTSAEPESSTKPSPCGSTELRISCPVAS